MLEIPKKKRKNISNLIFLIPVINYLMKKVLNNSTEVNLKKRRNAAYKYHILMLRKFGVFSFLRS